MARPGTICACFASLGNHGISNSHVCVDLIFPPSAVFIMSGLVATCKFLTGAPGKRKCPVAPASAMAWSTSIFSLEGEGGFLSGGRLSALRACPHACCLVVGVLCLWGNGNSGLLLLVLGSARSGPEAVRDFVDCPISVFVAGVRSSEFIKYPELLVRSAVRLLVTTVLSSSSSSAKSAYGLLTIFWLGVGRLRFEYVLSTLSCDVDGAAPRSHMLFCAQAGWPR